MQVRHIATQSCIIDCFHGIKPQTRHANEPTSTFPFSTLVPGVVLDIIHGVSQVKCPYCLEVVCKAKGHSSHL